MESTPQSRSPVAGGVALARETRSSGVSQLKLNHVCLHPATSGVHAVSGGSFGSSALNGYSCGRECGPPVIPSPSSAMASPRSTRARRPGPSTTAVASPRERSQSATTARRRRRSASSVVHPRTAVSPPLVVTGNARPVTPAWERISPWSASALRYLRAASAGKPRYGGLTFGIQLCLGWDRDATRGVGAMRGQVRRAGPVVGAHRGVQWRVARAAIARALIVAAGCGVFALVAGPAQAAGTVPHANRQLCCASATSCTAVGTGGTTFTTLLTLAEHWNGTSWAVRYSHPSGATTASMSGVACPSTSVCFAVGKVDDQQRPPVRARSALERGRPGLLNGRSPARAADKPKRALGASCSSVTACTAVGNDTSSTHEPKGFAERWNGTSWAVQTLPDPSNGAGWQLYAVSGSPRPHAPRSAPTTSSPEEQPLRPRSAGTGRAGRSKPSRARRTTSRPS